MLEALKLKQTGILSKVKTWTFRQKCFSAIFLVLLILFFTEYSPIHFLYKFFIALADVVSDFNVGISRDIRDCRITLWTNKNPSRAQVILENSSEALASTNFNK